MNDPRWQEPDLDDSELRRALDQQQESVAAIALAYLACALGLIGAVWLIWGAW